MQNKVQIDNGISDYEMRKAKPIPAQGVVCIVRELQKLGYKVTHYIKNFDSIRNEIHIKLI